MTVSDRQLTDSLIGLIHSSSTLIAILLDEEVDLICQDQAPDVARLTRIAKARDHFAQTAKSLKYIMDLKV